MENKRVLSKKNKFFFYIVMVLLPLAGFALTYISYAGYKAAPIYQNIKTNQRGWKGNVHVADSQLGFAPVPNSEGAHVFPTGPDIPMRFDKDGFRVPIKADESVQQRPLILALGCSFTYGDATYAKDTFPYLVGDL